MGIKSIYENFKDPNSVKPWDYNKDDVVSDEVYFERKAICEACPELFKLTQQCKECGCFMPLKSQIPSAECPLKKWGRVDV